MPSSRTLLLLEEKYIDPSNSINSSCQVSEETIVVFDAQQ